jgi:hypothetical protein
MTASEDETAVMTRENPSMPGSLLILDSRTGGVLQEHPGRWGYGVMFTSDGTEVLSQPGGIDEPDEWLGPFQAVDDEGTIMTTYDAPCPDYYRSECAENPDWFWLFSTQSAMSSAATSTSIPVQRSRRSEPIRTAWAV